MANVTPEKVIDAVLAAKGLDDVPRASVSGIQATGGTLLKYEAQMNAFVSGLVNRILFQEVHDLIFENPLKMFKGAEVPYGTDVQDSIANPAIATPYDMTAMADVLTPHNPDVKTVYYRRNRQDKYPVTIYDAVLQGAFINGDAFTRFYAALRNSIINGDTIDEYRLMVNVLENALDDGNVIRKGLSQTTGMTNQEYYASLVQQIRTYFLLFGFPSTAYNSYLTMATAQGIVNPTPLKTWTPAERAYVLVRADVLAAVDVNVLAAAFNMDKANFLGRMVVVDTFGTGQVSSKTLAVLCDKTAVRAHDNLLKMAETPYNASTLSRTFFLHHWETIAYSPFANCVAFTEGDINITPTEPESKTSGS